MHGAVQLFGHSFANHFLAFEQVGYQLDVSDITNHHIGLGNGCAGAVRHVVMAAWANAHQHDFSWKIAHGFTALEICTFD